MVARWGEITWALLTFIVLVVLPLAAINYLPTQTMDQLSSTGIDLRTLATETAMLGIVISAIALAKAIIETTSIAYLVLDVSINIVTIVFALLVVGVGNIGSLGLSSFSLKQGNVTTEITLDLRVFIWLTIATVLLSVTQSVARFREARANAAVKSPGLN
jgi:membrane protease YdiL (CAAX protease family)